MPKFKGGELKLNRSTFVLWWFDFILLEILNANCIKSSPMGRRDVHISIERGKKKFQGKKRVDAMKRCEKSLRKEAKEEDFRDFPFLPFFPSYSIVSIESFCSLLPG